MRLNMWASQPDLRASLPANKTEPDKSASRPYMIESMQTDFILQNFVPN